MAFEEKTRVLPARGQAPAPELLRELVNTMVQDALRAEFDRFLGAAPYERTPARRGHRNGSYPRTLQTRVGASVLDAPRDRAGLFRASLFAKYAEGLVKAAEDFPTPPVPATDLRAKLDTYEQTRAATVVAETAFREQHAIKDEAV
jgi:hypothetical protein